MSKTHSTTPVTFFAVVSSLAVVELFSGVLQVYFSPVYATLGQKFGVSVGTLSWALTAFELASVVFTPLLARLGDLYGHRKVLKAEAALVAIGSIVIAVAPNFDVLLLGRVLQASYAAYLPLMFGVIRTRYSDDHLRRGVAYLTSVLIFGVLLGLVGVGFITKTTSDVTWVLWLPAVGTAVGFALTWLVPNESGRRAPGARVDWPGVVLLAGGLVAIVWALTEGPSWGWASARIIGLLVLGSLVLAGWTQLELRVSHPLIDVRFLFRPVLVPVFAIGFCIYFVAIGAQVAVATVLELPGHSLGYGFGLSSWHFSLWYALVIAFTFLATSTTARTGKLIGFKPTMLIGCVLVAVGYGGLSLADKSFAGFIIFLAIGSGGAGFIEAATRTVVVALLREGEIAIGEGVYELAILVGGSIGAAVTGGILSANAVPHAAFATLHGYRTVFVVVAAVGLLAAVIAAGYLLATRSRPSQPAAAATMSDAAI